MPLFRLSHVPNVVVKVNIILLTLDSIKMFGDLMNQHAPNYVSFLLFFFFSFDLPPLQPLKAMSA